MQPVRFLVEATEVRIYNYSVHANTVEVNKTIDIIKTAVKEFKELITHAQFIIFYIDDHLPGRVALRSSDVAGTEKSPPHRIHVIAKSLVEGYEGYSAKQMIAHELKHFYDYNKSAPIRLAIKSQYKLAKLTREHISSLERASSTLQSGSKFAAWKLLREYYGKFFRALQYEGLATYVEKDPVFTVEEYERLFLVAKGAAKLLARYFQQGQLEQSYTIHHYDIPILVEGPYSIGLFLVFSLMYHHIETLDEIAHVSFMKFIETYEALAIKLGEPVLVSITSGRGILDYSRLVREAWEELVKKK